jgi:protocatechuate 3,4-dioxygenase beta subunit
VLRVLKVLTVVLALGALVVKAQAPAANSAIGGTVVDAATGKPVGAVLVTIVEGPNTPPLESSPGLHGRAGILTGADGRFLFRDLAAGRYTITATKNGYAEGASGRRRIGGKAAPVASGDAQSPPDITVSMWKLGAISGTVIDEAGEPVVGAQLRVLARATSGVRGRYVLTGRPASTDDRGIYRVSSLPPGDYLVVASAANVGARLAVYDQIAQSGRASGLVPAPPGTPTGIRIGDAIAGIGRGNAIPPPPLAGHLFVYPPTFHPSALDPERAAIVTLASGEDRGGIDLQLQPVPTATVSGRLVGPGLHGGEYVRLTRPRWQAVSDLDQDAPSTMADSDDRFVLPAVPAGEYVVRTSTTEGSARYFVATPITVAGPEVDVTAITRPVLRVTFRYEFEGETEKPAAPSGFVSPFLLERVDGGPAPSGLSGGMSVEGRLQRGAGRFHLDGFEPGRYRVAVGDSPTGWMFKSAMLNGVDVSETPFELSRDVDDIVLTFTDRWSGVSGVVRGGDDVAAVLVFTANSQAWESCSRRCRTTTTGSQGKFGLSSLPPGDYYVVAIPEARSDGWTDPKMLDALARIATRVTILEGEYRTIDLELRQVPQ